MFDKYIDRFMPSEDMKAYLKNEAPKDILEHRVADLVYYSPCPAKEKLQALKEIVPLLEDDYKRTVCANTISDMEEAMKYIEQEGVFVILECWYDYDEKDSKDAFGAVCADFKDVREYIRQDLEENEADEDSLIWYRALKWVRNQRGKYMHVCDYIIFRDEIIYTSLERERRYSDLMRMKYYDSRNLNLPVPFSTGDIIEVDGFPFGPKYRAAIVTIGDNLDCCCVQAIAKDDEGKWDQGALKHGSVGPRYSPKISPLYSAKVCGKIVGDGLMETVEKELWKGN